MFQSTNEFLSVYQNVIPFANANDRASKISN